MHVEQLFVAVVWPQNLKNIIRNIKKTGRFQ